MKRARYTTAPDTTPSGEEIRALTAETRKLRRAIERQHRLLLNGQDAALALGYSGPIFRKLVAEGIVPATQLDEDLAPRYSVRALERLIAERTTGNEQ